jgi:hypothetical protein
MRGVSAGAAVKGPFGALSHAGGMSELEGKQKRTRCARNRSLEEKSYQK